MKKIWITGLIIALAMVIVNCAHDGDGGGSENNTPNTENQPYSKEYWGEWVRMDTGASWIITNNKITTGADSTPVTAALTKQSERVIKATSEGKEIYLFAARIANSGFTGKISFGDALPSASLLPGASRSAASTAGVTVTVTNKNNPSLTANATTDSNGNFAIEEIIPGDEYTVSAGGQTAPVLPTAPDVDVGTITLTSGINFKTTITPASGNTTDTMQMYAKESDSDTFHRYSFVINVHNTGTVRVEAAPFTLTPDTGLTILSQPEYPILGTILPGASKEIPVTVACEPLTTEDNVLKNINITLRGVDKTWNDAVSLRFNKQPVTFYIAAKSPAQGVIITPYSKAYQFSTDKISPANNNSYVTSVTLPWSKQDYLAVFSGATLATESSYSFGVNTAPSVDWSQGGGLYAVEGEPANNNETGATALQTSEWHMGYLHEGDIDFYKISLGDSPPESASSDVFSDAYDAPDSVNSSSGVVTVTGTTSSSVTLSWSSVSGVSYYNVERSTSSSFSSVTSNTTTSTSYTVSSLSAGTTYYFRVKAVNSSGSVSTVGTVSKTTSSTSSSGVVTVTGTTPSSVTLSWSSVSGASSYSVSCSTSSSFSSVTTNTTTSTSYTVSSLSAGTTYYFRVKALNSYGYEISTVGTTSAVPGNSAIALTSGVWADGSIASSSGEQWFRFTATASTQYIHVSFGTLSSLYIQLYNSSGTTTVGSQTNLSSSNRYVSRSLTSGQTYYIKVSPYSSYTGSYSITFNTSSTAPIPPSSSIAPLTSGVWADGSIASSSGEQWFSFTATASTQYIHVSFGTLSYLYIQLYDSSGATVDSQTVLYSSNRYVSRSLTTGQTYYIKVSPYSSYTGSYNITFNTSSTLPSIALTSGVWADGSIASSSGEQWFRFTATAYTQYIHVSFGTLSYLYIQLYDSSGTTTVGSQTLLYSSNRYTYQSLTSGQTYYIKVSPYSSGTYQIAFNTSSTAPY